MAKTIEFFINNKLFKTCSYNKWNDTDKQIVSLIKKKGYIEIYGEELHRNIHHNAEVYVNPKTFQCVILNHRINTGYKDGKGNNIYEDDKVNTPFGFVSTVNGLLDWEFNKGRPTPYYVRKNGEHSWEGWHDYDIEDFSEYEKIEDEMGLPKKMWNNPDTITIKEF